MQKLAGIKMYTIAFSRFVGWSCSCNHGIFWPVCKLFLKFFFMGLCRLELWKKELRIKGFIKGKGERELNLVDDSCMLCPSNLHKSALSWLFSSASA